MGYFNYFIKCCIRRITYLIFKPKVLKKLLLIALVLFAVLFLLKTSSRAEFTDQDSAVLHVIALDIIKLNNQIDDLNARIGTIQADLTDIQPDVGSINESVSSISADVLDIQQDVANLRQDITALKNYASNLGYLQVIDGNIRDIDMRCQSLEYRVQEATSYIYQINNGISEIVKYFKQGETIKETVSFSPSYINSIGASPSTGKFNSVPDSSSQNNFWTTFYIPLEKGETYSISLGTNFYNLRYGYCQDVPAAGVPFSTVNVQDGTQTFEYSFIANGNYSYFYISLNMRTYLGIRNFTKTVTTTADNPLNIFENQQKQHEETIASNQANTDKITSSVTESANKIDSTLTSTDVSEDTYNIDTSFAGDIDEASYDSFLTDWINSIIRVLQSRSTITLDIPIPFVNYTITVNSDLIFNRVYGTSLYTFINVIWYFIFGAYFFRFGYRSVHWLTSGELVEKGPATFATYLMKQNAVITSDLM